jgi:hypothetical protein
MSAGLPPDCSFFCWLQITRFRVFAQMSFLIGHKALVGLAAGRGCDRYCHHLPVKTFVGWEMFRKNGKKVGGDWKLETGNLKLAAGGRAKELM